MSTTTIHPPTGRGAHKGAPAGNPEENIQALRFALRRQPGDGEEVSALIERHEAAQAELGLRLVRAQEALADLAAQAWRLEQENARLSADNRLLREDTPLYGGRRRRWTR